VEFYNSTFLVKEKMKAIITEFNNNNRSKYHLILNDHVNMWPIKRVYRKLKYFSKELSDKLCNVCICKRGRILVNMFPLEYVVKNIYYTRNILEELKNNVGLTASEMMHRISNEVLLQRYGTACHEY